MPLQGTYLWYASEGSYSVHHLSHEICIFKQKCAKALAFLPTAHGDAASWSSLMRRVLIAVNADLDFAFRGMEDGEYLGHHSFVCSSFLGRDSGCFCLFKELC